MDSIVLDYRDPLVSVIIFFSLVFLISFITYSIGVYKEKNARKDYRKLLNRFELGKLKEEDYVHLYKTYNLPFDSIILLASSFLHKGDYNKAISVYLALLEHVTDRVKKEELLELLGSTYFKGGFLQRSKEIYLKVLKFSPRNENALKHLLIINERLKEYDKALEIIEALEELDIEVIREKIYIETQKLLNTADLSYKEKTEKLYSLFKLNHIVERLLIQYLIQYNKKFLWEHIDEFDINKFIDLLWYLDFNDIDFDVVDKNKQLSEIYNAKGYLQTCNHSEDFVFDILIALNKHEHKIPVTLDFEFICTSCKQVHPIYELRCPHCHNILTYKVKYNLTKDLNERNQSLQ
ncbi:tetratricopeptide repeat protein [Arcobacter sp. CECT 8986]|uniref:tetratricopeptide repeat protein n=1 Tax=Arcobacter sp. CECT 8986 TaxID=2044507 RepID=UPI00100992B9|nr:tetratricopeptide repeat protein [Arcobacter sp. CECT 8986]RXJ99439.1 tetratricopeptide repeat protein [Arcobacter sp. CECT 8986]